MTGREYKDAIAILGLSQVAAAHLFGVNDRTSRRWADDRQDVPEPVARFLRYLIATKKTGAYALKALGL